MAELADAQASGACGSNIVRVQVPFPALNFIINYHQPSLWRKARNDGFFFSHTSFIVL